MRHSATFYWVCKKCHKVSANLISPEQLREKTTKLACTNCGEIRNFRTSRLREVLEEEGL